MTELIQETVSARALSEFRGTGCAIAPQLPELAWKTKEGEMARAGTIAEQSLGKMRAKLSHLLETGRCLTGHKEAFLEELAKLISLLLEYALFDRKEKSAWLQALIVLQRDLNSKRTYAEVCGK